MTPASKGREGGKQEGRAMEEGEGRVGEGKGRKEGGR